MNRLEQLIAKEITDLMALRVAHQRRDGDSRRWARELAQVEAELAELGVNVDELA